VPEPDPQPDSCSVCGRTILAGERTREYVTRDGEPRAVCELCRARAEAAGWIPAELAETGLPERERNGRGRGRMRRFIERARETAAAVGGGAERPAPEPEFAAGPGPEAAAHEPAEAPAAAAPAPEQAPAPDPEPEAPTPRAWVRERVESPEAPRPRRRRGIPQSPNRRIKRAFEIFNETDYPGMLAGLIRSLGPPWVSAFTSAATPAEVRITVAWELSWYQWEVDLTSQGIEVRELAKGDEVGQLDEDDRSWNAHATEEGELRFGAAEGDAEPRDAE
jgi:hypothetical protein